MDTLCCPSYGSKQDVALLWLDIPAQNDGYHMGKSVTIAWPRLGQGYVPLCSPLI